jgi:hypothetical protein
MTRQRVRSREHDEQLNIAAIDQRAVTLRRGTIDQLVHLQRKKREDYVIQAAEAAQEKALIEYMKILEQSRGEERRKFEEERLRREQQENMIVGNVSYDLSVEVDRRQAFINNAKEQAEVAAGIEFDRHQEEEGILKAFSHLPAEFDEYGSPNRERDEWIPFVGSPAEVKEQVDNWLLDKATGCYTNGNVDDRYRNYVFSGYWDSAPKKGMWVLCRKRRLLSREPWERMGQSVCTELAKEGVKLKDKANNWAATSPIVSCILDNTYQEQLRSAWSDGWIDIDEFNLLNETRTRKGINKERAQQILRDTVVDLFKGYTLGQLPPGSVSNADQLSESDPNFRKRLRTIAIPELKIYSDALYMAFADHDVSYPEWVKLSNLYDQHQIQPDEHKALLRQMTQGYEEHIKRKQARDFMPEYMKSTTVLPRPMEQESTLRHFPDIWTKDNTAKLRSFHILKGHQRVSLFYAGSEVTFIGQVDLKKNEEHVEKNKFTKGTNRTVVFRRSVQIDGSTPSLDLYIDGARQIQDIEVMRMGPVDENNESGPTKLRVHQIELRTGEINKATTIIITVPTADVADEVIYLQPGLHLQFVKPYANQGGLNQIMKNRDWELVPTDSGGAEFLAEDCYEDPFCLRVDGIEEFMGEGDFSPQKVRALAVSNSAWSPAHEHETYIRNVKQQAETEWSDKNENEVAWQQGWVRNERPADYRAFDMQELLWPLLALFVAAVIAIWLSMLSPIEECTCTCTPTTENYGAKVFTRKSQLIHPDAKDEQLVDVVEGDDDFGPAEFDCKSRRIIGVVMVVLFVSAVLVLGLIALCLRLCKKRQELPTLEVDIPVPASPQMRVDKQDLEPIDPGVPEASLYPGSGPQVDISRVESGTANLFYRETTFREHDRYVQNGTVLETIPHARAQRVGEHDVRTGAHRMSPTKQFSDGAFSVGSQSATEMHPVARPVHSPRGSGGGSPVNGQGSVGGSPIFNQARKTVHTTRSSPTRQVPSPLRDGRDDSRPQWWM